LLAAFGRNLPPTEIQAAQLAGGASSAKSEYIGKDETNQSRPPLDAAPVNPGIAYSDGFYDFLKAQIVSTSTKVIASPTLILQDNPGFLRESQGGSQSSGGSGDGSLQQGIRPIGIDSPIGRRRANEGVITVGTNVVTDYSTQTTQGAIVCTPKLSPAGLVLGARIEKIDDNGFVTFSLSPSISAITGTEDPPIGCGSRLNILSVRSLDTGALRVRDGQTLVMTGVISDFDRTEVSKWPILGDLPLVGQFFRASGRRREKRELVILATPRIIDDEQGGTYGYGYIPSTNDARQLFYGSSKR
jgi:type IV pilus assembly protein PilQ